MAKPKWEMTVVDRKERVWELKMTVNKVGGTNKCPVLICWTEPGIKASVIYIILILLILNETCRQLNDPERSVICEI